MQSVVKAQKWEYESSFQDGDGGPVCTRENPNETWRPWSLQDQVLRKAPVYLLNKCPGLQDHLSPSVLPLHLWRCKWKKDYICILGTDIFFDILVLLLLANVQMTLLRFSYNPCMNVESQVRTNYAIAALKLWVLNFSATVSYSMSLWWV